MRILITNDDNIHAAGLAILKEVASQLASEVWVVAPELDQSGVSHSISLARPLHVRETGARQFAVTGSPADCVIVALKHLMPAPPDLILSGVNEGANVGKALAYSGTFGAAHEGMLQGILSMALSQSSVYCRETHCLKTPWDVAETYSLRVIKTLLGLGCSNRLFNINFPVGPIEGVRGLRVSRPASGMGYEIGVEQSQDSLLRPVLWLRPVEAPFTKDEASDHASLKAHYISVSPFSSLGVCEETLQELKNSLKEDLS